MKKKNEMFFYCRRWTSDGVIFGGDEVGVCCVLKTEMDKKSKSSKSDFGYFLRNH